MPSNPLSDKQQQQIVARTCEYIETAARIFACELPAPPIHFRLSGLKAGMYKRDRRGSSIHYNPHIFARYLQDSLQSTVPHEVAHYVTDVLYGLDNIRPHGAEWKAVMHALGARPERTCQYDISTIPHRRERRHTYRCECNEYQLTTRRHNKIQKQKQYYLCKSCKGRLVYTPAG